MINLPPVNSCNYQKKNWQQDETGIAAALDFNPY